MEVLGLSLISHGAGESMNVEFEVLVCLHISPMWQFNNELFKPTNLPYNYDLNPIEC